VARCYRSVRLTPRIAVHTASEGDLTGPSSSTLVTSPSTAQAGELRARVIKNSNARTTPAQTISAPNSSNTFSRANAWP
jgi:hypothetical protein